MKKSSSSEYRKGFIYIFSSKILIIALGFLITPVLSRLYSPAEYGFFGLMSGVVMVLVLLSNLTLPQSLLTVKMENVRDTCLAIIDFSIIINFGFVVVVGLVKLLGNISNSTYLQFNIFSISLIALSSFVITLTQILANLNIREKAFGTNVMVSITESITIRISGLALALFGITKFGLFLADLMGKATNLVLQLRFKKWRINIYEDQRMFSLVRFNRVFKDNRNYPYFNLPSSLIAGFFNQAVLWILAISFSNSYVGYFTMATSLLNMPVVLLANSLQPLITAKLIAENQVLPKRHFLRMITLISFISFFTYISIYLLSPYFVQIYLGQKWMQIVDIVKILCLPFSLQLISASIQGAFIVYNKQRLNFIIKIFFLFALVLALSSSWIAKEGFLTLVIVYSIIVSVEEVVKILYLTLRLKYV